MTLGLLWGAAALADEVPASEAAPSETAPPAEAEPEAREAEGSSEPSIKVGGKLFARATADQRSEYARELSVPLARVQVEASIGLAEAVMEADIASSALVKDAYLRLHEPSRTARLYVGRFKAPFLERALQSRWSLPLISRGLVEDYLTGRNQLAGRRLGAMAEVKVDRWRELTVQAGLFQGAEDDFGERLGEDASVRVGVEPWKYLELGAGGYLADVAGARGRFAAGADATLKWQRVRLTLEGVTGRLAPGPFTAELAMLTYRLPVGEQWALEPLLAAEALQLRGELPARGEAAVLGANVHYGDRLRLQLQAERGLFPGDEGLKNRLSAQLGARF